MAERVIVIMAGGKGERFWPRSRLARPKHLLPIVGTRPMLAQTIDRLGGLVRPEDIHVITNAEQAEETLRVAASLPRGNVIAEPAGRDTTAVAALANLVAKRRSAGASLAILPADHVVHDEAGFRSTLEAAFEAVESEPVIATIAIRPTHPETGYGYVERGDLWREFRGHAVYRVRRFVEKPDLPTAEKYLLAGTYHWNGGIFVWSVPTFSAALERHAPDMARGFVEIEAVLARGADLAEAIGPVYPTLPKVSVDYAIMEKSTNVVTVPAAFDWDDVGAWPAIARHAAADADGNVTEGVAVVEGGKGNIVLSTAGHLTAVVGASDLVVVHTEDATLVVPVGMAQDVKRLVKRLAADPRHAHLL